MRSGFCVLAGLALACASSAAAAQSSKAIVVSAGAGGTFYCIITRCDSGTIFGVTAGYGLTPAVAVEAGVRRHSCFDCDRFVIADAALVLQLSARTVSPFAAIGVGWSSDPEFMGNEVGLLAAAGVAIWPSRTWGIRTELRGRTVGRGDGMGELSVSVSYRMFRSRR